MNEDQRLSQRWLLLGGRWLCRASPRTTSPPPSSCPPPPPPQGSSPQAGRGGWDAGQGERAGRETMSTLFLVGLRRQQGELDGDEDGEDDDSEDDEDGEEGEDEDGVPLLEGM